jgi:hypothetical protein
MYVSRSSTIRYAATYSEAILILALEVQGLFHAYVSGVSSVSVSSFEHQIQVWYLKPFLNMLHKVSRGCFHFLVLSINSLQIC